MLLHVSETVKEIEGVLPLCCDNPVYIAGERFKTMADINGIHLKISAFVFQCSIIHQGRVTAKVYIKDAPAVRGSLSDKLTGGKCVGLQSVHLPDDMITSGRPPITSSAPDSPVLICSMLSIVFLHSCMDSQYYFQFNTNRKKIKCWESIHIQQTILPYRGSCMAGKSAGKRDSY